MSIEETRSFAPKGEDDEVKTAPINERHPTLRALARGHNQLHECLDEARTDIAEIKEALGLSPGGQKVAGLSSQFASFRRNVLATTSSIIACALVYKFAILMWPGLALIWSSVSAAALRGMF